MSYQVRRPIVLVTAAVLIIAMGSFTAVRADPDGAKATLTNIGGATVGRLSRSS